MPTQAEQWFRQAVAFERPAAVAGWPMAQRLIGNMYFRGYGVQRDYAQALAWYRKATGDAQAELNIGTLYEQGLGVAQDYEQAMLWFRKAADQGNANAEFSVGSLFYRGSGIPQDFPKRSAGSGERPIMEIQKHRSYWEICSMAARVSPRIPPRR